MAQPYPYARLPRWTRAEADMVAGLHRGMGLWMGLAHALEHLLGTSVRVEVDHVGASSVSDAEDDMGAGWLANLTGAGGETVALLFVDGPLGQALAGKVLGGDLPQEPEVRPLLQVEEACLQTLLTHALARVGAPVRLRIARRLELARLERSVLGRVVLRVVVDQIAGWLSLWVDPSAWTVLTAEAGAAPSLAADRLRRSAVWPDLGREARVRVGEFRAGRRSLLRLALGDVLLPAAWCGLRRPERGVFLFGGSPIAVVELSWLDGVEFKVVESLSNWEVDVTERRRGGGVTSTAKTLRLMRPLLADRREVLELVLGGRTMTLAEVLELRPGRVVALSEDLDAPVELVLEGRIIGRGELVEVDGRLGVRIISIAN